MSPSSTPGVSFTDDGRGEPVVLLHAFPLDGRMWQAQRNDLAKGHRVVVPDLAGFGASKDLTPRLSLDEHADDVAHVLDRLGLERAALVGLSMGGYIALAFAKRHPTRLARLALADTRATPDTPEGKTGRDQNISLVASEGTAALVDRMLPKLLSSDATPETVAFARSVGTSQPVASVQAALAAMRDRPDSTALLARLDVPTAIVVGEADSITPLAEAKAMAAAVRGARLDVLPRAGHLANLEAPGPFTAAIARLLDR
jgi:pimeloyl-ACP methyl ester carboxylesterase